jgi:AmmeMemoRadiSam system protein B
MADARPSPIAGTWYSRNAAALSETIDKMLAASSAPTVPGEVIGIVVPHAGHRFSGAIAAHGFRAIEDCKPEVVCVISPLHHPHSAQVLTTGHTAYATPLGEIEVAHELLERLDDALDRTCQIKLERIRKDGEHSLEIELPFLQRILDPAYSLLPIMMRDQSAATAECLGHKVAEILASQQAILIASTDLSHFYPQEVAKRLDSEMLARIAAFDPDAVLQAELDGEGYACGRGAVAAVLWAARDLGANSVKILKYGTSGDITGDNASVVGYGAAVIYREA